MLFDFKCSNEHVEEHWVSSDIRKVRCSCGKEATRMVSGVRTILDPLSGDFPGATLSWARHHEKAARQSSD